MKGEKEERERKRLSAWPYVNDPIIYDENYSSSPKKKKSVNKKQQVNQQKKKKTYKEIVREEGEQKGLKFVISGPMSTMGTS